MPTTVLFDISGGLFRAGELRGHDAGMNGEFAAIATPTHTVIPGKTGT